MAKKPSHSYDEPEVEPPEVEPPPVQPEPEPEPPKEEPAPFKTVGQEQLERSQLLEQYGVEKHKNDTDMRKAEDMGKAVPGVGFKQH